MLRIEAELDTRTNHPPRVKGKDLSWYWWQKEWWLNQAGGDPTNKKTTIINGALELISKVSFVTCDVLEMKNSLY
jgi:hypothetical protein